MSYLRLLELSAPETIITVTALIVLAADLLGLSELPWAHRSRILTLFMVTGCAAAAAWLLALPQTVVNPEGMLVLDRTRQLVKCAIVVMLILTVLFSSETAPEDHFGEYLALLLFAAIGLMFLVSSDDILMIFVALELTSLSLYILAGFQKQSLHSAEAALKYFLFGGMSAAFTLFGLSLLYGLSGTTSLAGIARSISGPVPDPLLLLAIVMVAAGFGFKVAAAPFHLWAPDVYEAAPIPSAAFIASASKVAGFFVFARVMAAGFSGAEGSAGFHAFKPGWFPAISVLAAVSMFLGNVAALAQSSVRRLLAYSAIAHAGYMLLGVLASGTKSLSPLMYYAVTYALATLGAFGVVGIVQARTGGDRLANFAGLSRTSPLLAGCMLVFILSLAGIPPLAGFFGKFYLFSAALQVPGKPLSLLWLVALALVLSAVSLYYYLQVLKQIFVRERPASAAPIPLPQVPLTAVACLVCAGLVVLFGCAPEWLIRLLAPN